MMKFDVARAALVGALAVLFATTAQAGEWPDDCTQSTLPSHDPSYPDDQLILTCLPAPFNGTLIVYAHGYVRPQEPLSLPAELREGNVRELVEGLLSLGFGFATSSYHKNGYAVEQAEADLNDLVASVEASEPEVEAVYVVGPSEGGLITTLLVEKYPETYAGGLAMCGPWPASVTRSATSPTCACCSITSILGSSRSARSRCRTTPPTGPGPHGLRQKIAAAIEDDPDGIAQVFRSAGVACDASDPAAAASCARTSSARACWEPTICWRPRAAGREQSRTSYQDTEDDAALNAGVERSMPTLRRAPTPTATTGRAACCGAPGDTPSTRDPACRIVTSSSICSCGALGPGRDAHSAAGRPGGTLRIHPAGGAGRARCPVAEGRQRPGARPRGAARSAARCDRSRWRCRAGRPAGGASAATWSMSSSADLGSSATAPRMRSVLARSLATSSRPRSTTCSEAALRPRRGSPFALRKLTLRAATLRRRTRRASPYARRAVLYRRGKRGRLRYGDADQRWPDRHGGGRLPGDILIEDGKVASIGRDLPAGERLEVHDASGLLVMPGAVDVIPISIRSSAARAPSTPSAPAPWRRPSAAPPR